MLTMLTMLITVIVTMPTMDDESIVSDVTAYAER